MLLLLDPSTVPMRSSSIEVVHPSIFSAATPAVREQDVPRDPAP